jgi:hypothetical protein
VSAAATRQGDYCLTFLTIRAYSGERERERSEREKACRFGRKVWYRLRLAYSVAQVSNTDAWDHPRVAKDGWGDGEMIEESNSGAKKQRSDVDVELV